ncbi:AAA family ATPase [uncultured Bifidobacterium sp.]|uniref:DNA repair protein RecN n=1 Tax=uncultured Bifidobacterium sp. TaxID=165187 RepID=UPI0028DCECE5|nr:AAA family ATPase [uncultured Bifidobacterium sp.]
MLEELEVRDLGPIRHALIEPAAGMTAITGETGAGKSMLLEAIRLVSGGRTDAGRVSAHAEGSWAQAVFREDSGGRAVAAAREAGAEVEEGELFLTRLVPVSGRSRALLCGRTVPRAVLSAIASELVVVHGQSDQLRLASSIRQRALLDAMPSVLAPRARYDEAWAALSGARGRLSETMERQTATRQRIDYLRDSLERIGRVDPKPGEDVRLRDSRTRIEHAAAIAQGVGGAVAALDPSQLDGADDALGVLDLLGRASQSLRSIHIADPYDGAAERLDALAADVSDVVLSLTDRVGGQEEGDLDVINARIHELDELVRRWGPGLQDVLAFRDAASVELEDLDAAPERIEELRRRVAEGLDAARKAADSLHDARRKVARRLSAMVDEELGALAMSGSSLDIRVAGRSGPKALDDSGGDDVEFLFTPFPGSRALPLGSSASGGELSRLMLALELSTARCRGRAAEPSDVPASGKRAMDRGMMSGSTTFIFDEVDAGVGGRAAVELGRRLARLAADAQVIVVTHLAQVASWADRQIVVSKGVSAASTDDGDGGGRNATDVSAVSTTVAVVEGEGRVHEIARMLSGDESPASLEHARQLLTDSRRPD